MLYSFYVLQLEISGFSASEATGELTLPANSLSSHRVSGATRVVSEFRISNVDTLAKKRDKQHAQS